MVRVVVNALGEDKIPPENGRSWLPLLPLPGRRTDRSASERLLDRLRALDLREMELEYDPSTGAVWGFQSHNERPNFTIQLLADMRAVQRTLGEFHRNRPADAASVARFAVLASRTPGVFNLGGDLKNFVEWAIARDRYALRDYAQACIDVIYANYTAMNAPVVTAALVCGDALGGGFEAALSCDIIIAEEEVQFGLPEILYGLFPGMGAYSFLSRRLGQAQAERLILSGHLIKADEAARLGLVDRVVAEGAGITSMDQQLSRMNRKFAAMRAIFAARRRAHPIPYEELSAIVEDWVRVALSLSDKDLRKMSRLVRAQILRRGTRGHG